MNIFEAYLDANDGDKIGAATDLARAIMAHDPSDPLRMGYSLGSALLSVRDAYDLTVGQVAVVAERLVKPLLVAAVDVKDSDILEDTPLESELDDALENFGVAR